MGIPREELKSRLDISQQVFNSVLILWKEKGEIDFVNVRNNLPGISPVPVVFLPQHEVEFSTQEQTVVNHLLSSFELNKFAPPIIKNIVDDIGEELYNALIDRGYLIPLTSDVVFTKGDYDLIVELIVDHIEKEGVVSVAQVRDKLGTSRRYVLALLEHLDRVGITVRDGDVRKLKTT